MSKYLKGAALIGLVLVVGWLFVSSRPVTLEPGVMAPEDPIQEELHRPPVIRKGDYSIFPMASFFIEAKVLSRKRYRWGKESKLSPVDLALGWGPMSDENILKSIKVSQSGRWYRWRSKDLAVPMSEIKVSSANMHIIPADDAVEKVLKSVRKGQIVIIDGFLVRVDHPSGWRWISSTSRRDTGDGACEIIYAKSLKIDAGG